MTDSITLCGSCSVSRDVRQCRRGRAGRENLSISSCGLLVALPGEDAEADEAEHVPGEAPTEEQEVGQHDAADEQHQAEDGEKECLHVCMFF